MPPTPTPTPIPQYITPHRTTVYALKAVKHMLAELGAVKKLIKLLTTSTNKDVKYWSSVLLHALILEEPLQAHAVESGVVPVLVDVASAAECSATQGMFATQKLAMHALILLATSESTENHKEILIEMVASTVFIGAP